MGKRRGLGIERAYNKYIAPVYDAYGKMYRGIDPFPPKAVRRDIKSTKQDSVIMPPRKIPDSWGGQIPGKSKGKRTSSDDEHPPVPGTSSRLQGFGNESASHHDQVVMKLPFVRGIGWKKPGPVFVRGATPVRQQFAFDMTSGLNHRQFTRCLFRSYQKFYYRALANQPTTVGSKYLSPQLLADARTIDGKSVFTAVRDGNMSSIPTVDQSTGLYTCTYETANKNDILVPVSTLQDLENQSWNANPRKYISWNIYNAATTGNLDTAPAVGATNLTSLQVLKDWYVDNNRVENGILANVKNTSPYDLIPLESSTYGDFTRKPENYLADLGPGSIKLHFQNRLNTACEIDIVVVRLRVDPKDGANRPNQDASGTNAFQAYEGQIGAAYLEKFKGGNCITTKGFGGEDFASTDPLVNPTKPFLREHSKYFSKAGVLKQVMRDRFRILGGSTRAVTIKLPALQYDVNEHRRWYSAAATVPEQYLLNEPSQYVMPHSYGIYIATQGVVMPVFGAVRASGVVSSVSTVPLDSQVCPSSILVHGSYVERPKPCVSVSPTRELQLKSEIRDTYINTTGTTNGVLLSGYIADPPIATTTNTVVV